MSLRARLALLYTSIVGGILLLFGTVVYVSVSVTLTNQVDHTLSLVAGQILAGAEADTLGVELPKLDVFAGVFVQVWGRNRVLEAASMNIASYSFALDPSGLYVNHPVYRDVWVSVPEGERHLRVLTVPLVIENSDRIIGTLQLATSLGTVDATQRVLVWVLIIGTAISMGVAGLAGWASTNQALKPLEAVTQTALQITRADDLSRRIPYTGPSDDEVGQLIRAFNQTLSRLENLFNSQRRFLADVGHELRTPLTVIRGNVDLMRRLNCTDIELLESIENEVERLTRLVGDLLLLAQAESGKLPLIQDTVELDTLLFDVLSQMNVLAKDHVTLRLDEIDQVLVCGDSDRLKQVMVNLISNAIKYTPQGGSVAVALGKEGTRARLTVRDNGPGIPTEDMPHIFERFYRGEKSRTRSRDGKGFGLGLSIAFWIVRHHGGEIEVDSKEGEGTTFCVWLPLADLTCPED